MNTVSTTLLLPTPKLPFNLNAQNAIANANRLADGSKKPINTFHLAQGIAMLDYPHNKPTKILSTTGITSATLTGDSVEGSLSEGNCTAQLLLVYREANEFALTLNRKEIDPFELLNALLQLIMKSILPADFRRFLEANRIEPDKLWRQLMNIERVEQ